MKVSGPKVDKEAQAREERVAARAEADEKSETQRRLDEDTNEFLRVFGAQAMSSLFSVNPAAGTNFATSGGGGMSMESMLSELAPALGGGTGGTGGGGRTMRPSGGGQLY